MRSATTAPSPSCAASGGVPRCSRPWPSTTPARRSIPRGGAAPAGPGPRQALATWPELPTAPCRRKLRPGQSRRACVGGIDPAIEFLGAQGGPGQGSVAQAGSVLVGFLGDLGGLVIADVWVEGRHQHQGVGEEFRSAAGPARCPRAQWSLKLRIPSPRSRTLCRKFQAIIRAGTLSSKLPEAPPEVDGHIVAEDLRRQHGHGFALGGVDNVRRWTSPVRSRDAISPMPQQAGQPARTSLAIFIRLAARVS